MKSLNMQSLCAKFLFILFTLSDNVSTLNEYDKTSLTALSADSDQNHTIHVARLRRREEL